MRIKKSELRKLIREAYLESQMSVPEGGMDVLRAKHTQNLAEAIAPLYERNKEELRALMIPVLVEAAKELGGPGEASFLEEARSMIYDAIKVHLQDIVDSTLSAPQCKKF